MWCTQKIPSADMHEWTWWELTGHTEMDSIAGAFRIWILNAKRTWILITSTVKPVTSLLRPPVSKAGNFPSQFQISHYWHTVKTGTDIENHNPCSRLRKASWNTFKGVFFIHILGNSSHPVEVAHLPYYCTNAVIRAPPVSSASPCLGLLSLSNLVLTL